MKHLFYGILVLVLVTCTQTAHAQRSYNTSIGLRLGNTSGITIKGFVSDRLALEGIISTRFWSLNRGNVMFTGLLEWHFPIGNIQGFNWFIGGGVHVGIYTNNNNQTGGTYAGLDIIGGIEYTLPDAPFTFQADLKPTIQVVGGFLWFGDLAVSVRYAF